MTTKYLNFLEKNKLQVELPVAVALFAYAIITDNLIEMIIYMLYFIIFLEIIRALVEYTQGKRIKIRVLIDTFIILALREFIVSVAKVSKIRTEGLEPFWVSSTNLHILVYSGVILFLFLCRYIAIKTSPDKIEPKDPKDLELEEKAKKESK
jgi:uncharacterized membrane protein (DUF373 family)